MRHLVQRSLESLRRRLHRDEGVSLVVVAASLVMIMGMTAFGTDLAWFYVNGNRIQRAADAAALGGVVHVLTSTSQAETTARAVARTNGYVDGADGAEVYPQPLPVPTEYEVTIADTVPTFFLKVFGITDQRIVKTARAEYLPPLRLGSPDAQFGNSCDPRQPGCTGQSNFWANIHGRDTDAQMGDAYSSRCRDGSGSGSAGCPVNPTYRTEGYLYGIEPSGAFTVQFLDLAFHNLSGGNPTGDQIRTGDRGCEAWGNNDTSPDCGPTMEVTLYAPDPTPLDISDNAVICTEIVEPRGQGVDTDSYTWENSCGHDGSFAGTYVLRVRTLPGTGEARDAGLNRYSVRTTSGELFGLRDFSLYNNFSGSNTTFFLAEVLPVYAGKTVVVELYDPGDVAVGTPNTIFLQGPGGDWLGGCTVYTETSYPTNGVWDNIVRTVGSGTACSVDATRANSSAPYQGDWLRIEVDLPVDYTCTDCWWRIRYNYQGGGSAQDTTTWRAFIKGNPIRLIP